MFLTLKIFLKSALVGRFVRVNLFQKYFRNNKLIIVDVGSTGGLSPLWSNIEEIVLCYTFDPDSRAVKSLHKYIKIFNCALWSSKRKLNLHLTKFPDASSIYHPNNEFLKSFLNYNDHHVEKIVKIHTKKMDDVFLNEKSPDFIKIDTEGADLEILKGSKFNLENNILGIQSEVQFIERNIGSPLFGEIHDFLLKKGFWIMDLKKESWIRKNSLYRANSKPQLIWGDAIYMISDDEALKRGSKMSNNDRTFFLVKIILISLIYGFHDYACDILDKFFQEKLIKIEVYNSLLNLLKQNISSNWSILLTNLLLVVISSFSLILFCLFRKQRQQTLNFWKSSVIAFNYSIIKIISRTGRYKESVGDTSF